VKRIRLFHLARLALVSTIVAGCGIVGGGTPVQPVAGGRPVTVVTTVKAVTGPISQAIGYTGSVQPADTVSVVPVVSGRIVALKVDVGSTVKAGDVIAQLDPTTLNAQVEQAQAGVTVAGVKLAQIQAGARPEAVAAAQASADSAQSKLDAIKAGARPESVAVAQANLDTANSKLATILAGPRPENVANAKANLNSAISKLTQLKNGPTADQIASSTLLVQQAKNSLAGAQAFKDGQCNFKNPQYQCEAAQATAFADETAVTVANQNLKTLTDPPTQDAINQAQATIDSAQQQYNLALKPYTDQDIAQAKAAVALAQEQYQLAATPYTAQDVKQAEAAANAALDQAKLAAQPYTDLDVKSAQASVDQAQAALDLAKTQLAQANITAPFDGVISAKLLSVGALASPSTPIVSLNSPHLEVQFAVDESAVQNVKVGQPVSLMSTAFPGKQFAASVTMIAPSGDPKTHTFNVVVDPTDPSGQLKAGMFVTLQVTVASFSSATLVPTVALIQQGTQAVVIVVANGVAKLAPVTVGIADDTNTQIVTGVNPGDDIATSNQSNLTDGAPVRIAGAGNGGATAQPASGTPAARTPAAGRAPGGARPTATVTPAA
jgi:HlyD family secretion protein